MQKLRNLRIAGKVDVPHIVQPHDTGQRTGAFHRQPVIEHLDLNVRTLDAVIPVRDGVDDQLLPRKLRVFRLCDEPGIRAEIGALLDLPAHKLQRLFRHLQNAALEYHVLDDVHLRADLRLRTLISDKTDAGVGKETLRIPAKQQHGGGADCLLAALFRNELLVLPQVFLRAFSVAQLFRVRLDKAEVDVLHRRVRDRRILKIARPLCVHELQAFLKIELLGLIPDAEENLVRLIGVEVIALQHLDQQDVVGRSVLVHAGEPFRFHPHGGLAEVKRRTKQLVDMLRMAVDAGNRTVILHADSDHAAVRVGKGDQMNRQRFCIDAGALSVKERRFHRTADLRYRHSVIHVPTPSS